MWLLLLWACGRSISVGISEPDVSLPAEPEPDIIGEPDTTPRFRWMLHGGGAEDDAIFRRFVEAARFGHIVTLGALEDRADPDLAWWDGYFESLGAATAVTVNTASPGDLDDPALAEKLRAADGIFVRGGDQSRYVRWWGHAIGDAIVEAVEGGAILGGSSAGCAILGERVYDASVGSADPYDVLLDPYDPALTFVDGLPIGVPGVITDTHFTERGRLVRLAAFVARGQVDEGVTRLGVGVDPQTALFLYEDGTGEVMGDGSVTLLRATERPELTAGAPGHIPGLQLWQLPAGYEVDLRAEDPVLTRPGWVERAALEVSAAPFTEGRLDGDLAATSRAGSWELLGADEPYGWIDRGLTLGPGVDALPGTIVLGGLYEEDELAETHVGGLVWAISQRPGVVGVGIDIDMEALATPPRTLEAGRDSALVILDGRALTWAGAPAEGWQTAAVEGAALHIVGEGHTIDLTAGGE